MAESSVLQMVLLEEYERLLRIIEGIEAELKDLPKGYVSKKIIRGKESFYLQWRDGEKIKSKYLSADSIESVMQAVARRQELQKNLRRHQEDKKRLELALTMEYINANISQVRNG